MKIPTSTVTVLFLACTTLLLGCGDDGAPAFDASVPIDATACVNPLTDCLSPSPCHVFECVNQTCVEANLPADTACGSATDTACNKADTCDGNGVCSDNHVASGETCGSAAVSECDAADTCDGAGNCATNAVAANTACGDATVTECNGADVCDGAGTCSPNFLVGLVCGDPSADICNLADTCDAAGACTAAFAPPGTVCGDQSINVACNQADSCDGAGTCSANIAANGAPCGDPGADQCDAADSCNGSGACLPNFLVNGTACGSPTVEDCNAADSCDGAGTCLANLAAVGSTCGDPSNEDCDNPDTCNAIGDCLDNFATVNTLCGDATNDDCDKPDTCNATGTCLDNFVAAATACGDLTTGDCDNADSCNGAGTCADNFIAINTPCGDLTSDACDNADSCDGVGTCRDNNVANGVACDDNNPCSTTSVCQNIVCEPTVVVSCEALWCFDNSGFTLNPNVGQGTVAYGAGLTATGNGAGNTGPAGCPGGATLAAQASGWNAVSYATAAVAGDCYEITVATGLDPMVLSFDNLASADGPTTYGVEVQIDSASPTQVVAIALPTNASFVSTPMNILSLESLNIDEQPAAIVKICAFGASNAAGTWRVDNVRIFSGGCTDGVENGNETDIDCGGGTCPACT